MKIDFQTESTKFLIITNRPKAGFFSSFIQVLGELHYCKEKGLIPVVFFSSNWVYWRRGGHNGAVNGWEYYFSPVSNTNIADLTSKGETYLEHCNIFDFDNERIVPNINPSHFYDTSRRGHIELSKNVTVVNKWPNFHLGTRSFLEKNRIPAYELISHYIRIHPDILAKVREYHDGFMAGKTVVGVHFRGAEHRNEIENWHGLEFATENKYKKEIDSFLSSNTEAKIFIATDTNPTLGYFKEHYGDRCIYYPSKRSDSNNSPHMEFGGAEIGEEILIEALLLSMTDYFVHGISNVAFAVLAFNPELRHADVYDHQLSGERRTMQES